MHLTKKKGESKILIVLTVFEMHGFNGVRIFLPNLVEIFGAAARK